MNVRRIVTGVNAHGKSIFVTDGPAPRSHDFVHIPDHSSTIVWATSGTETAPNSGADPTPRLESVVPGPGATTLLVVQFPPDAVFASERFDSEAAFREQRDVSPGLFEHFEEPGSPFHATPTVDYIMLLSGELWLVLDEGRETLVRAGDIVIQNGTRHAWQNRSGSPATMVGVLVGATR
jgi:uncharacterized cupin superfamily protein